jgi:hypothetical protein
MFRTVEDGTPIDFVLQNAPAAASATTITFLMHSAPVRPENGDR